MTKRPVIALTMGDPAGIGPELAVKAANAAEFKNRCDIIIYGCPDIIRRAAEKFTPGFMPPLKAVGDLKFEAFEIGKAAANCGKAAMSAVIAAVEACRDGTADAVVTCPMNKASVNLAGCDFTGHTELIAELCEVDNFAMMQSSEDLRVAFVTTHIALNLVTKHVTKERVKDVARLLHEVIVKEGIAAPKIAVAAINPHAGESGFMGLEDQQTVEPALEELKSEGIDVYGPFPPDVIFIQRFREQYDGILSMYHDQGHIPFKMLAFDRGVNSTLGLPISRTSPDHGTAFEIAWQGVADCGSLFAAIDLAVLRAK